MRVIVLQGFSSDASLLCRLGSVCCTMFNGCQWNLDLVGNVKMYSFLCLFYFLPWYNQIQALIQNSFNGLIHGGHFTMGFCSALALFYFYLLKFLLRIKLCRKGAWKLLKEWCFVAVRSSGEAASGFHSAKTWHLLRQNVTTWVSDNSIASW